MRWVQDFSMKESAPANDEQARGLPEQEHGRADAGDQGAAGGRLGLVGGGFAAVQRQALVRLPADLAGRDPGARRAARRSSPWGDHQLGVLERLDCGLVGRAEEERQLAEVLARAELGQLALVALRGRAPGRRAR